MLLNETTRKLILQKLKEGTRVDNRGLEEYRKIKFIHNVDWLPEEACIVELGNTKVISGVKVSIKEPFEDFPDEALLITNAEYSPTSSYETIAGPPDINDILLARLVDRAIRSARAIDFKKYVVKPGEEVYAFNLDIIVLDNDGNPLDAALLSSLAALGRTKINGKRVELVDYPVYVTFGKIGDYIIVDPNREEEQLLDAKISIAYNKNDEVVAIQKDIGEFTKEELDYIFEKGKELAKKLRAKLSEFL